LSLIGEFIFWLQYLVEYLNVLRDWVFVCGFYGWKEERRGGLKCIKMENFTVRWIDVFRRVVCKEWKESVGNEWMWILEWHFNYCPKGIERKERRWKWMCMRLESIPHNNNNLTITTPPLTAQHKPTHWRLTQNALGGMSSSAC